MKKSSKLTTLLLTVAFWLSGAVIGSLADRYLKIWPFAEISSNQIQGELNLKQIRPYLKNLADYINYPLTPNTRLSTNDLLRMITILNQKYNHLASMLEVNPPKEGNRALTLLNFKDSFRHETTINVAGRYELQFPFKLYRYQITNVSSKKQTAPLLYTQIIWNSVNGLLESAGLSHIENETTRALAIWRFISENRYHDSPAMLRKPRDHDLLEFLSVFGYGHCDEAARALAQMAEELGLKSRVWFLNGHVVAEVYADGRWIMLDSDQQFYFYAPGNPQHIYSVDELSKGESNSGKSDPFESSCSLSGLKKYPESYKAIFRSTDDNEHKKRGTTTHAIEIVLRPGESVNFCNYNWGKVFTGGFSAKVVPKYYNGYFEYHLSPMDLHKLNPHIQITREQNGVILANSSDEPGAVSIDFSYPFPILGGAVLGTWAGKSPMEMTLADDENRLKSNFKYYPGQALDISGFFSGVRIRPTYRYTILIRVPPKSNLFLGETFCVRSDFQFAELALWKPSPGKNRANLRVEKGTRLEDFKLSIYYE